MTVLTETTPKGVRINVEYIEEIESYTVKTYYHDVKGHGPLVSEVETFRANDMPRCGMSPADAAKAVAIIEKLTPLVEAKAGLV